MSSKPEPTASRAPPKPVPPVVIDGVRYAPVAGEIDRDGQIGGILGAFDSSNRELWRLRVYENVRVPGLEGDVQDIYFRSMRADGRKLLIENEIGERFEVDTVARRVFSHLPPRRDRTSIRSQASSGCRRRRKTEASVRARWDLPPAMSGPSR